jgi:hypothetical protein
LVSHWRSIPTWRALVRRPWRKVSSVASAAIAAAWEGLEEHFEYDAALVARFRASARRMWESGINEVGERLTSFERDACGALLRVVWHLAARITCVFTRL